MATADKSRGRGAPPPTPATETQGHLTARGYAKHRGVSHQAVVKALREGRLSRSAAKVGAAWHIDPVLADLEWDRATDPAMQRGFAAKARRAPPPPAVLEPPPNHGIDIGEEPPESLFAEPEPLPNQGDFQEWRTRREELHARLLWIEYLQKCGRLLDVNATSKVVFDAARELRNQLLGLPSKLSGEFAGSTDPRTIAARLERALFELIESFITRLAPVGGRRETRSAG